MRVLICGDRNWTDREAVFDVVKEFTKDTVIIEGEARGADSIARECAEACGLTVLKFPADWARWGRRAGPIRNFEMLSEGKPDRVVAFHSDLQNSKGTKHMVELAQKHKIPVYLCAEKTATLL